MKIGLSTSGLPGGIVPLSSSLCCGTKGGCGRSLRAPRDATPTIWRRKPSSALGNAPTSTDPRGASDAAIDADRLLAALSPQERAALTLCFGHGWSHGEAAEIMGVPLGTLKSLVLRGRAKVQKMIGEGADG